MDNVVVYTMKCVNCNSDKIGEYKGVILQWVRAIRRKQGWKNVDETSMFIRHSCGRIFTPRIEIVQ